MNTEHNKPSIKDRVLQDIRSGDVKMTPRSYFIIEVMTLVAIAVAALLITVFLFNFISFIVRINDQGILLRFGPRGIAAFAHFFPWYLLILDMGLVILLQWLLRQFRSGYRIPVLYVLAGLLVAAACMGFALDQTSINDRLMERSGTLPPPFGILYRGAHRPPQPGSGICRCVILAIEGNRLIVQDTRGATTTLTVVLPENDSRATTTSLQIGDAVFIAGEEKDGVIQAFGVRHELPAERGPLRPMLPR